MKRMLIYNISSIATFRSSHMIKGEDMKNICIFPNVAIYIEDGIIRGIDKKEKLIKRFSIDGNDIEMVNANGHAVVPGFVDSHTHFVFGGYRPDEFIQRLRGDSYLDIMKKGGGIRNTVLHTREASFDLLYQLGKERIQNMIQQGVTSIEGKSGYGLDLECEIKQLKVMECLRQDMPMDIATTYLGAHAVADEYSKDADRYIDYIIQNVLPVVKKETMTEFCDVFCEKGVFDVKQSERLLRQAKDMGFRLKIHADEMEAIGGSRLAAKLGAVSADHLLMASSEDIKALAESDTIATLLPCTAFCLNKPYANARKMIDAGCAVALASDFNPGSCFTDSIALMIALAVIHMKMTMEEALCAITINGAAAIGKADQIGTIEEGKQADINILHFDDYKYLIYHTGMNIVDTVIKNGNVIYQRGAI